LLVATDLAHDSLPLGNQLNKLPVDGRKVVSQVIKIHCFGLLHPQGLRGSVLQQTRKAEQAASHCPWEDNRENIVLRPKDNPQRSRITMKTRAAVAWEAGKPLEIEMLELDGPKAGEVLLRNVALEKIPRASSRRYLVMRVARLSRKSVPA
jgi:hypothetical protein